MKVELKGKIKVKIKEKVSGKKSKPSGRKRVFAPVSPQIDPALIADPTDNTMLSSALTDDAVDIDLTITDWGAAGDPNVGEFDQMWLLHLPDGGAEEELHNGQYDRNSVFPFDVTLDKDQVKRWGEGGHTFFIRVVPYNNPLPVDFPPLHLIFDRVAPYPNQMPNPFPAIAAVLDTNIGSVELTLPGYPLPSDTTYPGWDAKDTVGWVWRKQVPVDPGDLVPDGTALVTTVPLTIPVPQNVIEDEGDGGILIAYILQDKAGNRSAVSRATRVTVALGNLPVPADFQKPLVLDMNNGVVDQDAVLKGIEVQIDAFQHFKSSDLITLHWGTHDFAERAVGTFPVKQAIPASVILDIYGKGSTGVKPVDVTYEVRRGDHPLGGESDTFDVNLERIGPIVPDPDPEWPGPVNPQMALPDVYGGNDNQKNHLTENDDGADAELRVTIDAAFAEDDLVEFYYTDEHVIEADYQLEQADPGNEIKVTIPWAYILRHDNGNRFAHYEVSRAGVPNKAASGPQPIVVEAIVIHPEAAEILGGFVSGGRLWLNCTSLFDPADPTDVNPDVRINIPDLSKWLANGEDLTLTWTATQGTAPGGLDIPNAKFEKTIQLNATNPPTGFVWRIPYADGLKPIYEFNQAVTYDGLATFIYAFERNGKTITSEPAVAVVSMHSFTAECPLVRP
ncbi:TPA: hypothetical protein ACHTCR_003212 [Pseudomonas putida]|nr:MULTISPECIES: hypothetical protein [Pseudomonas]APE97858.1 hypothetical protein BG030_07290 [Pseudomonas putida]MBP0707459.1 hypothetical protein [Pseudomonas sp. T34]MCE1003165.1 hypothetical protein [Pseudomonas sp. NMI1173_11]MCK2186898.1 hypothetical protein [Pseudomonas sp. MB04B]MDD2085852.1 hypothetical protein [Pseudomonas putida]